MTNMFSYFPHHATVLIYEHTWFCLYEHLSLLKAIDMQDLHLASIIVCLLVVKYF